MLLFFFSVASWEAHRLVEIGFITTSKQEKEIKEDSYLDSIGTLEGPKIARYIIPLDG